MSSRSFKSHYLFDESDRNALALSSGWGGHCGTFRVEKAQAWGCVRWGHSRHISVWPSDQQALLGDGRAWPREIGPQPGCHDLKRRSLQTLEGCLGAEGHSPGAGPT